ncbi:MAG: transcription antitermination factor NusB [Clostridiales bacterium]|nr:transcription antitermination factor NusB [Clostridiales bacterium]
MSNNTQKQKIREMTMQLIYQMDATGDFDYSNLSVLDEDSSAMDEVQTVKVLEAIRDHITEIDSVISACLDKWTIERVSRTDLAILRNAVCEMMYIDDLPANISISEAVRMSHIYGDEKSYAFVNSVLSKTNRYLKDRKADV